MLRAAYADGELQPQEQEADEEIDLAENEYLRNLASALALPPSALEGLVVDLDVDVDVEEVRATFHAIAKRPPSVPSQA